MKSIWAKCLNLYNKFGGRETLAYLIIGFITTVLSFALFQFCYYLWRSVVASNAVSAVIAVVFAFFANKVWVFRSTDFAIGRLAGEMVKFLAGRGVVWLAETALLYLLIDRLGMSEVYCKIGTTVMVVVMNYVISKWFVFKKDE